MVLTLIVALASLIALMVIHEFGHFIIAKKFGVRVEEFGIGYPPRIFGKKIGETIYSVNWLPLGAFVRIYGEEGGVDDYRSFVNLKIWQRVLIIIGGVVAFWLAAIVLFTIVFAVGTSLPVGDQDVAGATNPIIKITAVSANSPAQLAGLKPGDIILSANKVKDFQDYTNENLGKEITIKIKRGDKTFDVSLTPRVVSPSGEGPIGIGLERMATLIERHAWYQAPVQGTIYTWQTTVNALKGIYALFASLFSGKGAPQGTEFAGPLGITVFLARAADIGVGFFLYFIATISVFIAVFNLFPIPALDGGKLIFLIIEKIKGKPVSAKVEQTITIAFFILLISLSLFITVKFDIPRFAEFLKASL